MIVLVGFMAAGKTTVARLVARRLGLPFVDTDELIEERAGRSIPAIFAAGGEASFRELERKVVAEVLDGLEAVVALGGGALGDPETRAALQWATVVHLDVSLDEALRRIEDESRSPAARGEGRAEVRPGRPMLDLAEPAALHAQRRHAYESVADFTLTSDGLSPEALAARVASLVGAGRGTAGSVRRIVVPLQERAYEVVIGAGLASRGADFLPELPDAERAVILTHDRLAPLCADFARSLEARGLGVQIATVPEGEGSKSLGVAGDLYERLGEWGMHRHDLIVGFGGGVVCDLAGFVASTFNRGIPLVYVATSLLAQVDAAIGGKTAINLDHGKNLVGTFYQPAAVVCDVELLTSLDEEELRSGMAEVVKYGLIADQGLLTTARERWEEIAARDRDLLTEIVARSVAIKAGIVAVDETEQGERAYLNYGHTFGHAIERAYGYRGIRHGEAVSLGMVAAAYLAEELGLLDHAGVQAHLATLQAVGLPTRASLDFAALERAWLHDKKYRRGVRFVLLEGLARPRAGVRAPSPAVKRAVERLAR